MRKYHRNCVPVREIPLLKKLYLSDRGIFLTEAVYSVCILTFLLLLAFPILNRVYQERLLLQQKNDALLILRTHLIEWKSGTVFSSGSDANPLFHLDWKENSEHHAVLAVSWKHDGKNTEMSSEASK